MYRSPPPVRGNRSRVHDRASPNPQQFGIRLGNGHHIEELLNLGQDLPARPHLHCLLIESWRHIKRGDKPTVGRPSRPIERPTASLYSKNRSCVGSRYGITLCSSTLLTATRPRVSSRPAPSIWILESAARAMSCFGKRQDRALEERACHWRPEPSPQGTLGRAGHTCESSEDSRHSSLSNRSPVAPAHQAPARVDLPHQKANTTCLG